MRSIPIDNFFEDLDEQRRSGGRATPATLDWARLVAEGRAARVAADGGRWRIGRLALLVEGRYASGALQRFAGEIGESYATVRRYRWVAKSYDANALARYSTLSFSHFQAAAGLPDKLIWLERAERGSWSVDRLTRECRAATAAPDAGDERALDHLRSSIARVRRWLAPASLLDDAAIADAGRDWLGDALAELSEEVDRLKERVTRAAGAAAAARGGKVARMRRSKPKRGPAPRKAAEADGSKSRTAALKARAVGR